MAQPAERRDRADRVRRNGRRLDRAANPGEEQRRGRRIAREETRHPRRQVLGLNPTRRGARGHPRGSREDPRAASAPPRAFSQSTTTKSPVICDDVPRAEVVVLRDAGRGGSSSTSAGLHAELTPSRYDVPPKPSRSRRGRLGEALREPAELEDPVGDPLDQPQLASPVARGPRTSRSRLPAAAVSSDAWTPSTSKRPTSRGTCAATMSPAARASRRPRSSSSNRSRVPGDARELQDPVRPVGPGRKS